MIEQMGSTTIFQPIHPLGILGTAPAYHKWWLTLILKQADKYLRRMYS
ncbi:MAG: hypothetical protein AAB821_03540 [Patescibacteria group bacterium]